MDAGDTDKCWQAVCIGLFLDGMLSRRGVSFCGLFCAAMPVCRLDALQDIASCLVHTRGVAAEQRFQNQAADPFFPESPPVGLGLWFRVRQALEQGCGFNFWYKGPVGGVACLENGMVC